MVYPRFFYPQRVRQTRIRRLSLLLFSLVPLFILWAPQKARLAGPPTLITKTNSTRAIAVESITLVAEPFAPTAPARFAQDNRTRVMIFVSNLNLLQGEGASSITAEAEDVNHIHYPLTVEYVGTVSGFGWMTAVIRRLNDNLGDVGDVLVGITLHGDTSNRVRIGIGHVGGGPPDDVPPPQPTPDLGPGARFPWKRLFPPDNAWNEDVSISPVDPN